jgi:hypothetical protein
MSSHDVDLHKVDSGVFHLTLLQIPRGLILGALYSEKLQVLCHRQSGID